MKIPAQSNYFPTIDVLRGFAAISVVVYHVIELFEWKDFPITGLLLWFRVGWMGVDLFFVISGFVIGLAAFSSIDKHGSSEFRGHFISRRITRIVPLHYLTMLVFLVFIQPELLFENFWLNIAVHLLFVHNFSVTLSGAINGANWSLATEMQFYLLMMLFAPWLRIARLWKIFLLFVGVAWAWRFGVTVLVVPDKTLGAFPLFVAATQLPGMLDEFAIGILLARFVRAETGTRILSYFNNNAARVSAVWILAGLLVYATMSVFWPFSSYWDHPLMIILFRTLLAISFGVVVFAASIVTPSGLLGKIVSPFYYLGTISYGIYLWHLPVLLSLKHIAWLTPIYALPLVVGITIIFATVSWYFFEQPLIQKYSRSR
jgi:peptidoglycan/LPS O-acetylase OafA/YrhL